MLLSLATAWMSQGNITAGLMTLKQVAQVDPNNVTAYLQMGEVLRHQNDINGAIEAYRRALAVQPDLVEAQEAINNMLRTQPDAQ